MVENCILEKGWRIVTCSLRFYTKNIWSVAGLSRQNSMGEKRVIQRLATNITNYNKIIIRIQTDFAFCDTRLLTVHTLFQFLLL